VSATVEALAKYHALARASRGSAVRSGPSYSRTHISDRLVRVASDGIAVSFALPSTYLRTATGTRQEKSHATEWAGYLADDARAHSTLVARALTNRRVYAGAC
jgi:Pyruvate/2-oxoacid:ferredoxin oxidoreductase gamma subunit